MDIIVSKVYDIERFTWFLHLKYEIPLNYAKRRGKQLCKEDKHKFTNLTEVEVRYLQTICNLKIIPKKMNPERNRNIPPYLDNERTSVKSIKCYQTMKQNQFKFEPFDQVLVRDDDNDNWYPAHYKCYEPNKEHPYICDSVGWRQCIPYNEETKHLYNTNNSYQKPEQKEYHVWTSGTFNEWMTESEFKNFIETAVIHNKDITDFHVLRIRQ